MELVVLSTTSDVLLETNAGIHTPYVVVVVVVVADIRQ